MFESVPAQIFQTSNVTIRADEGPYHHWCGFKYTRWNHHSHDGRGCLRSPSASELRWVTTVFCTDVIEDDVLIGMGSIILDNAKVETGAFVGAATLITGNKTVPSETYAMGNPMKVIRANREREKIPIAYAWKHYVDNAERYKSLDNSIGQT